MQQQKSNRELKAMAREVLLGKYNVTVVAHLVIIAISMLCSVVVTLVSNPFTRTGLILYYLILFVVSLGVSIFNVGVCILYLNIVRGLPFKVQDVFYGFRSHADKCILTYLITFGISLVCLIPYAIFMIQFMLNRDWKYAFIAFPFLLAGSVVSFVITLRFALVYMLLADYPELSVLQLYKKSMELMHGQKTRWFLLNLSFIGWGFVAILSCGVGTLWISPYIQTATAYFYLDVTGELSREQPEVIQTPPPGSGYYTYEK